jgi:DNA polymerase-3 subunit alpha
MKRMKEADAMELFASVADIIDIDSIPLDDNKTYELLFNGDTDGVYMMESNWDKYDLLQIKPKNFEELIACVAFSHNSLLNPYIYTYLKMKEVHPFTYPIYTKIEYVESVLKDTYGLLLYQHQAIQISDYIEVMSNEEKETYKLAIRIMKNEIERRKRTLADYSFFEKRALLCYRMAYIKSNMPEHFSLFMAERCEKGSIQS